MNKRELHTIKEAAQRFASGTEVVTTVVPGDGTRERPDFVAAKVYIPFTNQLGERLYFFISKRGSDKRFSLLIPVESTGVLAVNSTLHILQAVLQTYNLIVTQEATIMEREIALPLHTRMARMSQVLIAIDGIRRLWKTQLRSNDAESQVTESTGDGSDDRPSR